MSPDDTFKTLHPDEWGYSLWYPLLALRAIEEAALPVFKGRKAILKALKKSRQRREWIIGNYYWALWKWRMKEIHEEKFKFVPRLCTELLRKTLLTPIPAHLLPVSSSDRGGSDTTSPAAEPGPITQKGDLTLLPPPVSCLVNDGAQACLSRKGKSILRAITVPLPLNTARSLTSRERILRALTDDAYA